MVPSRASSQPRDQTQVSRIAGWFFSISATREACWLWNIKKKKKVYIYVIKVSQIFQVFVQFRSLSKELCWKKKKSYLLLFNYLLHGGISFWVFFSPLFWFQLLAHLINFFFFFFSIFNALLSESGELVKISESATYSLLFWASNLISQVKNVFLLIFHFYLHFTHIFWG